MGKRFLGLFLAILLVLTLGSCSSGAQEEYSLQIWTYYNGNTDTSFKNIVDEYNSTRGLEKKIVVTSVSKGSRVSDLLDALLDSATGKLGASSMPDLFLAYPDCAFELDKYDKLVSLDKYFSKEELSNYNEGFLNEGRFSENGDLKILPVAKSTEALYVNKTDFDKFLNKYPDCGVSYSDLSTIEGIIKVSQAYYERTGNAFFGRDSLDNYFVIGAKKLGVDILHYDSNGKFGVNFDRDIFKKLWDSYYVPYVKGYFTAIGKFRSDDIKNGKILIYIGSTSSGGYFPSKVTVSENESYEIESEILCTPVFENGSKVAVSQGAGFCITKSVEKREKAAVDFLKWLCEKENITKFANTSGYFPATKDGFSNEFIESQKNEHYKNSFSISKKTTEEYTMYTNVVGVNGTNYRNTLRDMLASYSKKARDIVLANGETSEIIAEYTSLAKFDEWFNAVKEAINKI